MAGDSEELMNNASMFERFQRMKRRMQGEESGTNEFKDIESRIGRMQSSLEDHTEAQLSASRAVTNSRTVASRQTSISPNKSRRESSTL